MTAREALFLGCGIALVFYTIYVIARVVRNSGLTKRQKAAQIAIVLLVPLAGPLLVHVVHRTDREEPGKTDKNFERQDIGAL